MTTYEKMRLVTTHVRGRGWTMHLFGNTHFLDNHDQTDTTHVGRAGIGNGKGCVYELKTRQREVTENVCKTDGRCVGSSVCCVPSCASTGRRQRCIAYPSPVFETRSRRGKKKWMEKLRRPLGQRKKSRVGETGRDGETKGLKREERSSPSCCLVVFLLFSCRPFPRCAFAFFQ